jgi:hypothetical protein
VNTHSKKAKFITAIALLTCAHMSQVFAESGFGRENRLYFGFGVTASDLAFNETNLSLKYSGGSLSSFDHTGNAFKLFGGYQFDPLLGVELGLTSFGEIVMDNSLGQSNLFTADAAYIAATATRPITKNISALAKLGMSFWTLNDNDENNIESGQGLIYGAGLDFNLYGNNDRSLLVEWEHYNFSGVALKEANQIGASLVFRF